MNNLSFPVGAKCAVQLDAISSDITVSGWAEPRVQVESEAEEDLRIEQTESNLRINAHALSDANIKLHVPSGCSLQVSVVSGDISCQGLGGEVNLATTSGDIKAQGMAGHLHVHNVSGDAHIGGAEFSAFDIETVSGDIQLTASLEQDGNYSLHTISGDILLKLPADERCLVLYQTLSGELNCQLPHQVRHLGWGKLEALVNDGGVALRCSSTNGDLTIRAEGDSPQAVKTAPGAEAQPLNKPAAEPFDLGKAPVQPGKPVYKTRLEVLKAIEEKRLSVQEGLALLQKLS